MKQKCRIDLGQIAGGEWVKWCIVWVGTGHTLFSCHAYVRFKNAQCALLCSTIFSPITRNHPFFASAVCKSLLAVPPPPLSKCHTYTVNPIVGDSTCPPASPYVTSNSQNSHFFLSCCSLFRDFVLYCALTRIHLWNVPIKLVNKKSHKDCRRYN